MNIKLINKIAKKITAGFLNEYYTSYNNAQETFKIDFLKINGNQLTKDDKYSIFINVFGTATFQEYEEKHTELEYNNREYFIEEIDREVEYDDSEILIFKDNINNIIQDEYQINLEKNDYIEIKFKGKSYSGKYEDVETKILQDYVDMIEFNECEYYEPEY